MPSAVQAEKAVDTQAKNKNRKNLFTEYSSNDIIKHRALDRRGRYWSMYRTLPMMFLAGTNPQVRLSLLLSRLSPKTK